MTFCIESELEVDIVESVLQRRNLIKAKCEHTCSNNPANGLKNVFFSGGFPSFRGPGGGFEGFRRQIRVRHVKISPGSSFEVSPLEWRRFHKGQFFQKKFLSTFMLQILYQKYAIATAT